MKKAQEPNDNERYFEWWLDDLYALGLVHDYEFEPKTFLLVDPLPMYVDQNYVRKENIIVTKTLYPELIFTPDYRVVFDAALKHKLFGFLTSISRKMENDPDLRKGNVYQNTLFYVTDVGELVDDFTQQKSFEVWFDVKSPSRGHGAESAGELKYKQRLMFNRHGIIVNKVVPIGFANCLFNKTFTPSRYLMCDNQDLPRRKKIKGQMVPISELATTVSVTDWLESKKVFVPGVTS